MVNQRRDAGLANVVARLMRALSLPQPPTSRESVGVRLAASAPALSLLEGQWTLS